VTVAAPAPPQAPEEQVSDAAAVPPSPSWLLNGEIGLAQSRYLHLDVDLVYQVNTPVDQSQEEPAIGDTVITHNYRLHQSRRIRSANLFYFDHPRFGMVARVSPYTPPPPPPPLPAPPQREDAGQVQGQKAPKQ